MDFGKLTKHKLFWPGAILFVSLAIRIPWAGLATVTPVSDYHGYHIRAQALLAGEEFGYAAGEFHGLAWRTPGYPFFLVAVYSISGPSPRAAGIAQAFLGGLTSLLIFFLAMQIVGRRAALVAALLHALQPRAIAYVPVLASENLATPLGVGCFLLLAMAWKEEPGEEGRRANRRFMSLAAGAGLLLGLALLVRPSSIFFLPGCVLVVLLSRAGSRHASWPAAGMFLLALLIVLSPWLIRNARAGLGLTLSTSGGRNLYMGNNDQARTGGYVDVKPTGVSGLEERQRDAFYTRKALDWIANNPGRYAQLCSVRLSRLLGSQPDGWAATYLWPTKENDVLVVAARAELKKENPDMRVVKRFHRVNGRNRGTLKFFLDIISPLTLLALVMALRRFRKFLPVVAPWAAYILGLALTVSAERYRLPAEPLQYVFLAALLSDLLLGDKEMTWPGRRRDKVIATISVLLVYNIFSASGLMQALYSLG